MTNTTAEQMTLQKHPATYFVPVRRNDEVWTVRITTTNKHKDSILLSIATTSYTAWTWAVDTRATGVGWTVTCLELDLLSLLQRPSTRRRALFLSHPTWRQADHHHQHRQQQCCPCKPAVKNGNSVNFRRGFQPFGTSIIIRTAAPLLPRRNQQQHKNHHRY